MEKRQRVSVGGYWKVRVNTDTCIAIGSAGRTGVGGA